MIPTDATARALAEGRDIRPRPCADLPELEIVGRTEIQQPLPQLPIDFAPGCANLYLGYKGAKEMQCRGRIYTLKGGDCFFTPPGVEHSTGPMPVSKCAHYWLRIRLDGPAPFLGSAHCEDLRSTLLALPVRLTRCGEECLASIRRIYDLVIGECEGAAAMELRLQLGLFLLRIARRCAVSEGDDTEPSPALHAVVQHLRHHIGEDLSIADMAAIAGCSSSALSALFRRHEGVAPGEYFTRLKMAEAERLLLETDLPVRAISERLGYANERYFTTVFKRYHVDPPGRYRHKNTK